MDRLMDGKMADLFLTDPPYNVDYSGNETRERIENDNMPAHEFKAFLASAFRAAGTALVLGAAAYIFHADSEAVNFKSAFMEEGFHLSATLIWVKNSLVLGWGDYHYRHEPILYGWKQGAAHYFTTDRSRTTVIDEMDALPIFKDMKKQELVDFIEQHFETLRTQMPNTVLYCDKPSRSEGHPTMKPVVLLARLMMSSSREGDSVLDTFAGSGSTLIAAEQTGRTTYLMELDPKYCDVIVQRYTELLESAGRSPHITLTRDGHTAVHKSPK